MSEYKVIVQWERNEQVFKDNRYSRGHKWVFDGGIEVPASSSPHVVPIPLSKTDAVDPEEAFVASLSSCHMLYFLSIVAKKGFRIDSYTDNAVGVVEKNETGKMAMTRVTLYPKVVYSGSPVPGREVQEEIHHQAHSLCIIANSVKTDVSYEPVYVD